MTTKATKQWNVSPVPLSARAHTLALLPSPSRKTSCAGGGHKSPAPTFAVSVEHVQGRDEELVGILLLVACQVPRVGPHQVQQLIRDVRGPVSGVKLPEGGERKPCQE